MSRTLDGDGDQVDRAGLPGINTVLIPSGSKNDFNLAQPVNDPANFGDEVRNTVASLGGDPDVVANLVLPDLLPYDPSAPTNFANLNGRALTDDVIDVELALVSGGAITTDGVDGNDVAFRNVFPYLARPNAGPGVPIPSPSAAGAGLALLAGLALRRRRSAN